MAGIQPALPGSCPGSKRRSNCQNIRAMSKPTNVYLALKEEWKKTRMRYGPSIIFNRNVTAHISKIEGTGNIVEVVKTYGANALFPKCMMSWLPVGNNVHMFAPDKTGKWRHKGLGKMQDSFLENKRIERENREIF